MGAKGKLIAAVLVVVAVLYIIFLAQSRDWGTITEDTTIIIGAGTSTVVSTVELPTLTPTATATATINTGVLGEATDTPTLVPTATDTPTKTPTEKPTQTATPEMALEGGWTVINGDSGNLLTADNAVLILAFNGTDQPVYLYPDKNGKVDYSQDVVPESDDECGGILGVLPLNKADFKITLMPFRQDGHKLVLLDPTSTSCKVKDQDTILVSDHAESSDKSEVLRFGCKTEACARMVLIAMGKVDGDDTINCSSTESFVTRSDSLYKATYRGKNGWSIGDTNVGPRVNLGDVQTCKVGKTTWYVDCDGSVIWRSSKIAPAPTSTPKPKPKPAPQPTEVVIISGGSSSGGGEVQSGGSSDDSGGGYDQSTDQGGSTQTESGGGGDQTSDQSSGQTGSDQSGGCPGCDPEAPVPTPEPQGDTPPLH